MKIEKRDGFREKFRLLYDMPKISTGWKLFGLVVAVTLIGVLGNALFGTGAAIAGAVAMLGWTAEDQKELDSAFEVAGKKTKDLVETEMKEALKKYLPTDEFANKMKAIGLEDKTIEGLVKSIETQGEKLRGLIEAQEKSRETKKTLAELMHEKKAEFAALAKAGRSSKGIVLDIPSSMVQEVLKTNVTRASVTNHYLAERLPDVGQLGYLGAQLASLFRQVPVGPNSNGTVRYVDQSSVTRNADVKAEAAVAPESAIAWTEYSLAIEKILDSIPVSYESFNDVDFIRGEIERLLLVNMALKEDSQLYGGSGSTPNLKGVKTYAGAYDGSAFSGSVLSANLFDLIAAAKVTIMSGYQSKFNPDFVLLNPVDVFKYKVIKGVDGHYVMPSFVGPNGSVIDGVRVIESNQVTADTFVIGDSRYGVIYTMGDVQIEMGFDGNDFTYDLTTIKARKREALLIRSTDTGGFKYCSGIAAAVSDLTMP